MTADLSALIARLEAAEAGSRELDAAIWCALNGYLFVQWDGAGCVYRERPDWGVGHQQSAAIATVTTSLDAALALAERVHGEAYALALLQDLVDLNDTASLAIRDLPRLLCSFTLRAKLDGYEAEGAVNKKPKAQEG